MGQVTISCCRLQPELPDEMRDRLAARLSPEQRQRLESMRFGPGAHRSLIGMCMVRILAVRWLGRGNETLRFGCNAYGKPCLTAPGHFPYSVSHWHNLVVVATGAQELGADVEGSRKLNSRMGERFFTAAEWACVSAPNEGWEDRFLWVWTRKEAYIKREGRGLAIPLRSFDVTAEPVASTLWSGSLDGAALSVCCENPGEPVLLELEEETVWQDCLQMNEIG